MTTFTLGINKWKRTLDTTNFSFVIEIYLNFNSEFYAFLFLMLFAVVLSGKEIVHYVWCIQIPYQASSFTSRSML